MGKYARAPPGFHEMFVVRGIVGRVVLLSEATAEREALEAHIIVAPRRFGGIRDSTIHWPDPSVHPGNRRNARWGAVLSWLAQDRRVPHR